MDRLHAHFVALEYFTVHEFTRAAGQLKYTSGLLGARRMSTTTKSLRSLPRAGRCSLTTSSSGMMSLDSPPSSRSFAKQSARWLRRQKELARVRHRRCRGRPTVRLALAKSRLGASATKLCARRPTKIAARSSLQRRSPIAICVFLIGVPVEEDFFSYKGTRRCPVVQFALWGAGLVISAAASTFARSAGVITPIGRRSLVIQI